MRPGVIKMCPFAEKFHSIIKIKRRSELETVKCDICDLWDLLWLFLVSWQSRERGQCHIIVLGEKNPQVSKD